MWVCGSLWLYNFTIYFYIYYRLLCLLPASVEGVAATWWQVLISTLLVVAIRKRAQTLALRRHLLLARILKPASQPSQLTDPAIDSPATDSSQHKPVARASSSAQPEPTTRETAQRRLTSAFDTSRKESPSSSESDTDSLSSDRPPLDLFPEGELSDDQEANLSNHDQSLSEEQSYRETMRGIRSYMSWNHIPDIDSGATTSEDNPFAGPKLHTPGKVSVNLPTDEWLCRKMSKLNITLVQGYPTRTSEAGGLLRDQFVRPPKSQQKWYGFHANPKKDSDQSVSSWHTGSSKLNSTYLRIARQAGIATSPPMSRPISQENLRKWERSARESTVICNHAAGFNRCLLKIQESMNNQLKAVKVESKGKAAAKVSSFAVYSWLAQQPAN